MKMSYNWAYYAYPRLPSPFIQILHYVEVHAALVLCSPHFLLLSERMVHLVIERELQAEEIVKVKAILDWGEKNFPTGVCVRACVRACVCVRVLTGHHLSLPSTCRSRTQAAD